MSGPRAPEKETAAALFPEQERSPRRDGRGRWTTALSPVGRRGDDSSSAPTRGWASLRSSPAVRVAFLWPVHFLPGSGFALRALCSCESIPGARVPRRPRQGGAQKPESQRAAEPATPRLASLRAALCHLCPVSSDSQVPQRPWPGLAQGLRPPPARASKALSWGLDLHL